MAIDIKYGVPTVSVHTAPFSAMTKSMARVNGTPNFRQAYVPHPVMGRSDQELRAYVDGNDPITGRPVMQEVIEGLTKPLDQEGLEGTTFERTTPRLVEPDTEENLHRLFLENNWTDKLPIILPTEERVAEMLKHTSRKPDEIVGHMQPAIFREYWEYTVEKVAANAVMAGCRPEYFPVVLALAATGVTARGSSTSSLTAMAVVNGPIRNEIKMNYGIGALGPYNHANATIGRAYSLLSQNLQGGSIPGLNYMGSMGNNYAYNCVTFAENEERSPWEPFHVQHGFKPTDSAVSVFRGCHATAYMMGLREKHWREHVGHMMRGLAASLYSMVFLLDPIVARMFIELGGFDTKEKLIRWAYENATMKASEYWDYQFIQNEVYPRATFGEEPFASKLKAAPDEMVPIFEEDQIHVIVVGGETNGHWRIMTGNHAGKTAMIGNSGTTVSIDEWR